MQKQTLETQQKEKNAKLNKQNKDHLSFLCVSRKVPKESGERNEKKKLFCQAAKDTGQSSCSSDVS